MDLTFFTHKNTTYVWVKLLYMKCLVWLWLLCVSLHCYSQKSYKIISVHDGDTFQIIKNGKKQSCRVASIDAPELNQTFGIASRDSLRNLILDKIVIVDSLGTDLYRRQIVCVKVQGRSLDSLLVRKGFAWHYEAYSKNPQLKNLMQLSINDGLGIWKCGTTGVCPPWLYRKFNFFNKVRYCNSCNL
jgi:micrococcal nuclease